MNRPRPVIKDAATRPADPVFTRRPATVLVFHGPPALEPADLLHEDNPRAVIDWCHLVEEEQNLDDLGRLTRVIWDSERRSRRGLSPSSGRKVAVA